MVERQRLMVVALAALVCGIHIVQPQEFRNRRIRFFRAMQLIMLRQRRHLGQFAKQSAAAKGIQTEQQQENTGHNKVG